MADTNYITPVGLERIRRELDFLQRSERPRITREVAYAASLGDRSENAEYIYGKKRLREIDRRMRFLIGRLERVEVIDPGQMTGNKVVFGATVTIADGDGVEKSWKILGEDEVDVEAGVLSWRSPLSRALIGRSEGDTVRYATPGGSREVEIVAVVFEAQTPLADGEWTPVKSGDAGGG